MIALNSVRFGALRCANVIVSASALCTAGMFFGGLANHHLSRRDVSLGFGNLGCFSIYSFIYIYLFIYFELCNDLQNLRRRNATVLHRSQSFTQTLTSTERNS